jgi:TonB-linked SusC/RagA family outer membrane protein
MRLSLRDSLTRVVTSVGALLAIAAAPMLAQGIITGRVQSAEGKAPLGDVQLLVEGTSIVTVTNAEGRFTLRNVPPGPREVRAFRVGYTPMKKVVTVTGGQTATLEFDLVAAIVKLQEVVTTATGEQRRVELGHAVATVDVSKKVAEAPIKNMGDLLVAKAPGVQVLPANMTGGGSRVRIRGTSSISLSNDPIYIIDGIRMTSTASGGPGTGGTGPSRVNDINPNEIENIEIVKGPSAASLYGTDAANGVIVITTKRGRAGRTNWNTSVEHGQIKDHNQYPTAYAILGKTPGAANQRRCFLREVALGSGTGGCVVDSATSVNVYDDPNLTPLKPGGRDQMSVQVNGGTEATRYFISLDIQKETGPFGLPAFDKLRFDSLKTVITDNMKRPSQLEQGSFRSNVNASLSPDLDVGVTSMFTRLDQRFPQVDNNVNSFWYNGMVGPGFKGSLPGIATNLGSLGQQLYGYAAMRPGEIFQRLATQNIHRMIVGSNISFRPTTWLATRADLGVDLTDRADFSLQRFAEGPDFGTQRQGLATDSRGNARNMSANINASATWVPRPWINSKFTVGTQYVNFYSYTNSAGSTVLPPGAQNAGQGTIPSVNQGTTLANTLGMFVEEAVALNDRVWLTTGIRTDRNSAFGRNFKEVYYPKFSASWMASDEEFFPHIWGLSSLRLRTAYGFAGQQPGANDALRTFSTTSTSINGADVSGLLSSALGNSDIKPERTREFEAGFEAKVWDSRVNFDFTYYNKLNTDQLFNLPLAGSSGTAATSILMNLGATQNTGVEFLVNAQIFDSRNLAWDLTVSASKNANKIVTLGKKPNGDTIPSIGVNTTVQQRNGMPIYSYWSRPFSFPATDADGILATADVTVDTTWRWMGYSQARDEVSITNGFEVLNRRLRITVLADFKSGASVLNNEEAFLCQQSVGCPYISSYTTTGGLPTLYNQARALAYRDKGTLNTAWGFIEPLQFWRLREVSAAWNMPDRWATRLFRSAGASVNLAVRNIHVWTNWTGVDPEANYGENNTQQTLLTAGPPRYMNLRINLRY